MEGFFFFLSFSAGRKRGIGPQHGNPQEVGARELRTPVREGRAPGGADRPVRALKRVMPAEQGAEFKVNVEGAREPGDWR